MSRELVFGRQPVREALRSNRRQVHELLATERALAAESWLREAPGLRVQVRKESALTGIAGNRDHQGVVAFCGPYSYADAWEIAERPDSLVVCLDQVTDPQNLGAVCRSAEAAGASGIVVPERNSARVTAAVCKASAGSVEHVSLAIVVNLARYLEEIKGPELWVWAAEVAAGTSVWAADLTGGVAIVLGAEGAGIRPSVRRVCDEAFAIPLAGNVASLNVGVAAGVALFEAVRQRSAVPTTVPPSGEEG